MSDLINSSLNSSSSASNLPDSNSRFFGTPFTGQSGTIPGMHNIHGNYNIPNMPGALGSRNSSITNIPSGGIQQPGGNLSSGRFASSNLPVALSQLSHGSSHGHSGVPSRGINVVGNPGSIPGILSTSAALNSRNSVPGMGVSPAFGNTGPRITNSSGNMAGSGYIGRNINSGGGLSVPGLSSRLNLAATNGSGSLAVQGHNRLMSGLLPQGTSQVMSMFGNSYPGGGGPLSQNHVQAVINLSSMGMLNDVNSNDSTPFDINLDFPQLTSRPSSAGGPQGQLGSLRKQISGSIAQQNQEFSIQNEDFPALPGFKGGNTDYPMEMHQKEQNRDNAVSMMQSQHFSMGRSSGFNLGGSYSSQRAQQQQQQQQHAAAVSSSSASFPSVNGQDLQFHVSDLFPSSHSTYHSQTNVPPGMRTLNSNAVSGGVSYDQLIQQYQQQQNQSQFRLQQMPSMNQSFREQSMKPIQASNITADHDHQFDLLGLLNIMGTNDIGLASISFGIDLQTLGLNLNSPEDLHKTFGSPWSDEPSKCDPEFSVPQCYYAKQPPILHLGYLSKFTDDTLFFIFYSMPKDEAQLYGASELYRRGWFYHRELFLWLARIPNTEPLAKTSTHERGSYHCFDPNTFEIIRKENFVLQYEMVEKRPALPQH